ncbi:MAG: 2-oxoglutarate and iron-dependent oxygenase domain-containing protein [Acidimicrobiales bacterium]
MATIPVIDVAPARRGERLDTVGRAIDAACREVGFVTIVGHGIALLPSATSRPPHRPSSPCPTPRRRRSPCREAAVPGAGGSRSGQSSPPDDRTARRASTSARTSPPTTLGCAGTPLHGPNRYPAEPPGMRRAVEAYLAAVTALGQDVLRAMAVGLGLDAGLVRPRAHRGPALVLFRIFRYPPVSPGALDETWSVGEHTDYGLITLLPQDDADGLEVHGPAGWTRAVAPAPSS